MPITNVPVLTHVVRDLGDPPDAVGSQLKLKEYEYERFTKPSRSDPIVQSAGSGKREKRYHPGCEGRRLSFRSMSADRYWRRAGGRTNWREVLAQRRRRVLLRRRRGHQRRLHQTPGIDPSRRSREATP